MSELPVPVTEKPKLVWHEENEMPPDEVIVATLLVKWWFPGGTGITPGWRYEIWQYINAGEDGADFHGLKKFFINLCNSGHDNVISPGEYYKYFETPGECFYRAHKVKYQWAYLSYKIEKEGMLSNGFLELYLA